ncbi:MAG TPA: ABC transporter ATP-binding protein [Anaerolineales bacterium]|nr:ABC transporter ATP-binding protein [Anaerolineales bacterium]
MATPLLEVSDLRKSFGPLKALDGVAFDVQRGEVLAVLGPSGCGKSTLLAVIAGLENPDTGDIRWEGASLIDTPPHRRGFGLMFQDYALFPHMNVFENVAFGLRTQRGADEISVRNRVAQVLDLVRLAGYDRRDVNTLSGGEQQRVALARCLAPQPRLLMLDEPLGSLDRSLREGLLRDLSEILQALEQTALYVTHDQEEAFSVADRVALMSAGTLVQIGSPEALFHRPNSLFAARFLGFENLIPGDIVRSQGSSLADTPIGRLPVGDEAPGRVTILLRPDMARLNDKGDLRLQGRIRGKTFRGSTCRLMVDVAGTALRFEFPSRSRLPDVGDPVVLAFDPAEAIQVFR